MILGLDVGGTQTDSVLISDGEVIYENKTSTGDDLLETLRNAIEKMVAEVDPGQIERMSFSTTMATNAIVQDRLAKAGMIVTAGPGMDPVSFSVGPGFEIVEGCLDHRGFEVMPLDMKSVIAAARRIRDEDIKYAGIVGKFSVRNPAHEIKISEWIDGDFSYLFLGHQVSGALNFPRRITTTYLNAALGGLHHSFASSLIQILDEKGLIAPRYLLKPDGGTVGLEQTMNAPARTAQSGPAASVMGALALDGCRDTALVLDIGGTTTDISIILAGVPLLEPFGIRLGPFQTLIRSLLTYSVGIGGDSEIQIGADGDLMIGPLRQGPPRAFGGVSPTPTDAMVVLGMLEAGDRKAATQAMEELGASLSLDAAGCARRVLEHTGEIIADSAKAFVEHINTRPVYTIREVLHQEEIRPDAAVIIGGPAPHLAEYVGRALGLPHRVPPHSGVANAVGAAVARVTSEVTLQADTERGTVVIPEADLCKNIYGRFNDEDALQLAKKELQRLMAEGGVNPHDLEISVMERQVFNMIRGFSKTGQNIRLKLGVVPGIIPEWKRK
ncbi:MAG: hydantoinase/oxoprolinase family protein [Desulfatiglandales bacterium]